MIKKYLKISGIDARVVVMDSIQCVRVVVKELLMLTEIKIGKKQKLKHDIDIIKINKSFGGVAQLDRATAF